VFHILLSLYPEERHGYAIMQDVVQQTRGALRMGPGTLYGCLSRMLAAGFIQDAGERPDPSLGPGSGEERRRYYRITPLGCRAVRAETQRITELLSTARSRSKHVPATGKV
jgi:DNA-binding PadR family transcriptional regulator